MDSDDERSYLKAMLVVTVALGIVTAVVAVLVAVFPGGGGDDEPTSPGTTAPAAPGWPVPDGAPAGP
ncbi:hypothetical protein M3148_05250 [Georgenia satyanarayanai]|uniref:hypothetical protein n=1 Tax=Georgenia satyanarayanai TaxID=860221 RepID=UPI00203E793D|nr:hypothetical protein [Georgenia satyanarayanai]MCM3660402.1 hypothetical protein [Georgenia satyanarayanai]